MLSSHKILSSEKNQLLVLLLVAVGLNLNTLFNEYALDDTVVMTENSFVAKGMKGIPDILASDYISGYSAKSNLLSASRYRPLTLISFALEHEVFGANPFVSHLINLLLVALLIVLLFRLLKKHWLVKEHPHLAFFICLLFAVHPVHTEVVANAKGRDEILAFIFLVISLIAFFKYTTVRSTRLLVISCSCFFLALLTKETAVTFIAVVPLSFHFFITRSTRQSFQSFIPFLFVLAGYLLIRYLVVGFHSYPVDDVTNSPYLYATTSEAFATKFYIVFKYISLLAVPYPLTSDYGFNQIPYVGITSVKFIFSFLMVAGLVLAAVKWFREKSLFSFCILYFFITLSVGTNFIFDLGTPMAERILFQPSLAFCMVLATLFIKFRERSKLPAILSLWLILMFFSFQTIARNSEWKNNETLFLKDVVSSPNSSRMNLYACEQYIIKANKESDGRTKNEFLNKAVWYGERSLKIHSKFPYVYLRLGLAYYYKSDYVKAADLWMQASKLDPADPETIKWTEYLGDIFYKEANRYLELNDTNQALNYYLKSTELNPGKKESWFNLGEIYRSKNDEANAVMAWNKVKLLDPDHQLLIPRK